MKFWRIFVSKILEIGDKVASIGFAGESFGSEYFRIFRIDHISAKRCRAFCINSKKLKDVVFTLDRTPYYLDGIAFYHFSGSYGGVDAVLVTEAIQKLYENFSRILRLKKQVEAISQWSENLSLHTTSDLSAIIKAIDSIEAFLKTQKISTSTLQTNQQTNQQNYGFH